MRMRALAGLVVAATAATGLVAPAANAQTTQTVKPSQALATLLTTHRVISSLGAHPAKLGSVSAGRPITGVETVLPVVGRRTKNGVSWLQIRIPGRPNGRKGWIKQQATVLTTTSWHLVVRTSSRRVFVYRRGHRVRSFAAIVGKPSTPTPHGRFFVEESVRMVPGSAGGPFALATSARSDVLKEFDGGQGQIALHGIANLGGTLGTAMSHGCVRLSNRSIRWLAARIGPGVPVTIRR